MGPKLILLISLLFFPLTACHTDPNTQRQYFGISGPAQALTLEELERITRINGVVRVKDAILLGKNVVRVIFTPLTDECRKQWLGNKYCEADKRPVEDTSSFKRILKELEHFCGGDFETKKLRSSILSPPRQKELYVKC